MKTIKISMIMLVMITLTVLTHSQSRYQLISNHLLLAKSAEVMMAEVGIIETDNNSGERIRLYQLSVGLPDHSPYCAAGQYFSFSEAAKQMGSTCNVIPIPRTGLANSVYNYAKSEGRKKHYSASVNDLIIWRKYNRNHGHIERVISRSAGGWVQTVGFNSTLMINSKKVEGVFIQSRNIFHPIGKLRIRGLVGFIGKEIK